MQFEIQGFDKASGEARRERVKCDSEQIALQYAEKRGIIVEAIHPISASAAAPAATPGGYRPPAVDQAESVGPIPEYKALKIAARVLTVVAYVGYILSAVILVGTLYIYFTAPAASPPAGSSFRQPAPPPAPAMLTVLAGMVVFVPAVVALITSVFYHALGQGFLALRDIARNSFRR